MCLPWSCASTSAGATPGFSAIPEPAYPKMWRIRWADGVLSPMGNLTRAKEATISYARSHGWGGNQRHRWHGVAARSEAPQSREKVSA